MLSPRFKGLLMGLALHVLFLLTSLKPSRESIRIGSYTSYGLGAPLDGSSPMPNLCCFADGLQGRLLPTRTIRQGVHMGRSFSVYLFCFVMDPFFHYLNRIPGVISVQAYVDDTTIAGTAVDPKWICEVADVYRRVASAGFHVDCHTCFRSCINDVMKFQPRLVTTEEIFSYWPTIVDSCEYGTLQEAVAHSMQPGRCTRIVRISTADLCLTPTDARQRDYRICINLSSSQARDVLMGTTMHEATALLVGSCTCKSKSCVVTPSVLCF